MSVPADAEARGMDSVLLATVLALTAAGAVMVYSASAVTEGLKHGDQFYYLKRQLLGIALGLGLLSLTLKLGYRRIELLAYPILVLVMGALLLVLIPRIGHEAGGARRWIPLGPFAFQPAEAAKVALVLYLARSLARKRDKVHLFSIGFLPHLLVAGLMMALVLEEKDLGTCVVLFLVLFAMLFAAGARVSYLLGAVVLAAGAGVVAILAEPYRLKRILVYLDPWQYRDSFGFQMVESYIGIGNGGWTGQGLGEGKGKLFWLPAAHTDFIAAVIAEEAGLIGVGLLLALYGIFVWRGLKATFAATEAFGCYLALGLTALVGSQALMNLAVVFGVVPTKGLTLPFVSYGMSSMVTLLAASGLLLSVSAGRGGFLRRGGQAVRVAPVTAGGAP